VKIAIGIFSFIQYATVAAVSIWNGAGINPQNSPTATDPATDFLENSKKLGFTLINLFFLIKLLCS